MNAIASPQSPSSALHKGLWVVQGLLALAFLAAGMMKIATPLAELQAQDGMAWASRVPEGLIPFIGVSEVLGAVGLILPSLLRIAPKLTGVAAAALTLVMVLAAGEHLMAGEYMIVPNVVLGGLAAFVAWGRLKKAPIAPRA